MHTRAAPRERRQDPDLYADVTSEVLAFLAERIALAYQVFPKLEAYRKRGGQQLSGGERKMVSIARALAPDQVDHETRFLW